MLESPPKRFAASVVKRKFHSSVNTTASRRVPLPARTSGQTLASRLIPRSVNTSLLVDQLGVSLALPIPVPLGGLSDIAVLTLSAALHFRTNLTPLAFGLDTSRAKARMLIEEKATNASQHVGDKTPADGPAPPPAYSPYKSATVPYTENKSGAAEQGRAVAKVDEAHPPPTNLVHIYRRDGAIYGRWNVDPTLQVPSEFLPPTGEDARTNKLLFWSDKKSDKAKGEETEQEPMPNLKLHTRDGRIVADVSITGTLEGPPSDKPTLVDLYTRDGPISLRLRSRGPSPLHLKLYTHDGSVRVFLPRTFSGLLTHELRDGSLIVSPEMKKHGGITTFASVEGTAGRSFVGEWRGFKKMASKHGDESTSTADAPAFDVSTVDSCEVTSRDGNVYFYWEDEYEATMASLTAKGWLKSLFSR